VAATGLNSLFAAAQQTVPQSVMQAIYDEVQTPYKYGMVMAPQRNDRKFDCPTVFRQGDRWFMTYVCYDGKGGTDGRGYETWIAQSDDLLHWTTLGRVLKLPETADDTLWDQNQRGGFPSLIDYRWDGSYALQSFKGNYWMTYIGGPGTGYEAVNAPLSIGLSSIKSADFLTKKAENGDFTVVPWDTFSSPILSYNEQEAQWWEQLTQYKSTIYWMKDKKNRIKGEEKYPFVMYYNAGGKDETHPKGERIGIALSKDLKKWKRYAGNPVFAHDSDGTITGDAQLVEMFLPSDSKHEHPVYVMFYFSAYNPTREYNAFNTFAASYDLVNWTDWTGSDLIIPTKPYDEMFAHKSWVVKHDGIVYHFYCAVNNAGQRGIALATSKHLGRNQTPRGIVMSSRSTKTGRFLFLLQRFPSCRRCSPTCQVCRKPSWPTFLIIWMITMVPCRKSTEICTAMRCSRSLLWRQNSKESSISSVSRAWELMPKSF